MSSQNTGQGERKRRTVIKREIEKKVKSQEESNAVISSEKADGLEKAEGTLAQGSYEGKNLDEKLIGEFKRCLKSEESRMSCVCCNQMLYPKNMAEHLNSKGCKQIRRHQFTSREKTAEILRQTWEEFAEQNEVGKKIKCEFCTQSILKTSLTKHQNENQACLARQRRKKEGKLTGDARFLKNSYPELYFQIHPTLNGDLDKDSLTYGSGKEIFWLCKKSKCEHEHIWEAKVSDRACQGIGCLFCSVPTKLCGCFSFFSLHPELKAEYDEENNKGFDLDLARITPSCNREVWWKCSKTTCGHHVWKAKFCDRNNRGSDCGFCAGRETCPCDSFFAKHPDLLEEYDLKRNSHLDLDLDGIAPSCNTNVWWKCSKVKCGHHVWEASFNNRNNRKSGCRFCAGKETCPCYSLKSEFPEIGKEFDLDKNGELTPSLIAPKSGKYVWWRCSSCSHSWPAIVSNRTLHGQGCPRCKSSKMEKKADSILDSVGVSYESQYPFSVSSFDRSLKFDKFITSERAAVELDGEQHFDPETYHNTHSDDSFERIQRRDVAKNEYCVENSVSLLRISHSEALKMEEHITTFIQDVREARKGERIIIRFVGREYDPEHRGIMTCNLEIKTRDILLGFIYS